MKDKIVVAIALLCTSILGSVAVGAEPKARAWEGDVASAVIYGDVVSVEKVSPKEVRVTMNVKCTLMGPYDAAANPTLKATMYLEPPRGVGRPTLLSRVAPPRPQTHVVAEIDCGRPGPWEIFSESSFWWAGDASLQSFPSAAVEVTGFEDPKVAQIISRLRKYRAENPLAPWDAAHDAIKAEWANRKSPDGSPVTLPKYVEDFIHAQREATQSSRK
jgi:hypothetical protein